MEDGTQSMELSAATNPSTINEDSFREKSKEMRMITAIKEQDARAIISRLSEMVKETSNDFILNQLQQCQKVPKKD